ncbi:MAG: SdrD B-like domain-containing protein [bacterium]|nr:SdrD B-like domain-containing protein [bacterium]
MRMLYVLFLVFIAGCEKYDGSISNDPDDDDPINPVLNATVYGRVVVDGVGLDSVTVTISKSSFYSTKTKNGGYYTFTGLGAGGYVVFITNPDKNLYRFDSTSKSVSLEDNHKDYQVSFEGTYIGSSLPPNEPIPQPPEKPKAVITGVVYEDANSNGWYDVGEVLFPGVTVTLSSGSEVRSTATDLYGRYTFYGLVVGVYDVIAYGFESKRSQTVSIVDDNGTVTFVDFPAIR